MARADGTILRAAALVAAIAAGTISGCGGESYPPTAEGLFMGRCARCHEADGSSATASEIANAQIDLRDPFFQKNITDREIRTVIQYGVGRMQGVPNLTEAEVDSLVLQVRYLGAKEGS